MRALSLTTSKVNIGKTLLVGAGNTSATYAQITETPVRLDPKCTGQNLWKKTLNDYLINSRQRMKWQLSI